MRAVVAFVFIVLLVLAAQRTLAGPIDVIPIYSIRDRNSSTCQNALLVKCSISDTFEQDSVVSK